jgi:hypothetical protein
MTVITKNTGYSAYLLGMAHNCVVGTAQLLELPFQVEEERDWNQRCCTPNIVMASKTSDDLDKNDCTALMFKMSYATDVITFELYKNNITLISPHRRDIPINMIVVKSKSKSNAIKIVIIDYRIDISL